MQKYIHYCWFGDKKFPKLGKKCLKSWKKYLPDYKIIKWSEKNVDLDECPFIREAYDNKKWAFVADYVRTKALKEYGGIYFDTDMEVIKNIDDLLENETFLGVEDSGYVAVGVWYEKEADAFLPIKLLEYYKSIKKFDKDNLEGITIPLIISKILNEHGFKPKQPGIVRLGNGIVIYPRDYFYPYSYNRTNNLFTRNTRMIHYYDASWIPIKQRTENNLIRKYGIKNTRNILKAYRKFKDIVKSILKVVLFPVVLIRRKKETDSLITKEYLDRLNNSLNLITKYKDKEYIVFYNENWFGVSNATKELFEYIVDLPELYRKEEINKIGDLILNSSIKQIIFSSLAQGDKDLIKYIKNKNKNIKIKTYWHGNHSQVLDTYGWERNKEIIELHKSGYIDVMGSCKESLIEFYKNEEYKPKFLTNKVVTNVKKEEKKSSKIRIGLYAAKCDDWRKNMFSQMAAVSLLDNVELDMVPLNESAIKFAKLLDIDLIGEEKSLKREDLIKRMSKNDINLYVTFSECAPMLILESLEMDVPCISGNNHHYFKDSKLEEYLIVNNENDPEEIKNKILMCLDKKEEIIKLYKEFKKENEKNSKKQIKEFIEM